MNLRIVLADDHEIVRDGLGALLGQQTGMEVVAQADSGRAAVALTREHRPDVVVMDIAMPDLNGIEATRQIKAEMPEVRVIALSMPATKRAFRELSQAVRDVMEDHVYLSPKIADVVIDDYIQHLSETPTSGEGALTPREREVLQLLVEGKSAEQIAAHLHVSANTVGTHRHRIMEKLDIHSLPELTKYAIREGLTFLEP